MCHTRFQQTINDLSILHEDRSEQPVRCKVQCSVDIAAIRKAEKYRSYIITHSAWEPCRYNTESVVCKPLLSLPPSVSAPLELLTFPPSRRCTKSRSATPPNGDTAAIDKSPRAPARLFPRNRDEACTNTAGLRAIKSASSLSRDPRNASTKLGVGVGHVQAVGKNMTHESMDHAASVVLGQQQENLPPQQQQHKHGKHQDDQPPSGILSDAGIGRKADDSKGACDRFRAPLCDGRPTPFGSEEYIERRRRRAALGEDVVRQLGQVLGRADTL